LGLLDTLFINYDYSNYIIGLNTLTSIIGIAGFVLFKKNLHLSIPCILFWIIIQIPILKILMINNNIEYWEVIFRARQLLEIHFEYSFNYNDAYYQIGCNLIPFLFLLLFRKLKINELNKLK